MWVLVKEGLGVKGVWGVFRGLGFFGGIWVLVMSGVNLRILESLEVCGSRKSLGVTDRSQGSLGNDGGLSGEKV